MRILFTRVGRVRFLHKIRTKNGGAHNTRIIGFDNMNEILPELQKRKFVQITLRFDNSNRNVACFQQIYPVGILREFHPLPTPVYNLNNMFPLYNIWTAILPRISTMFWFSSFVVARVDDALLVFDNYLYR